MILDGLTLTVIGMSVVFVFLMLLVFFMQLLSVVVTKFFPEKEVPVAKAASPVAGDTEIAVAIAAAYRQQ